MIAEILAGVYKAFYTGTGYSGVHDPEWDRPPDSGFFVRTNFEKLKRHRKFIVDGNTIRAVVPEDNAGDPVTKTYDVCSFNSAVSLQAWLDKVKAQQADGRYYILPSDVEEDFTFPK